MKDLKDLADKINADKEFTMEAYNYIKTELDWETAKPVRKRNFDRIEQLTSQLAELSGDDISENTDRLYERIRSYEKAVAKPTGILRRFAPVLCCLALFITANCITVLAWDMNIVSAIIEFTKGGFSVDFGEEREFIELPTSEDDPYGIIAECAKYDIYPETPHYLPEGFELTLTEHNENSQMKSITFDFYKGQQSISIAYDLFIDGTGKIGIPSDDYNISETMINNKNAVISKEDNQFTITYKTDNLVTMIFTQDVPYDECDKIVASIK